VKERLTKLAKRFAPYVGYPIFYLVCLALFVAWTFPYNKLRERIVTSFNAQQRATNGTQELQIEDMSSYWVSGVRMKGVKLVSAAPEPSKPPSELKIDEARVRMSMLPLLIGHQNLNFSLDAFGGEVKGSFETHGKDREVEVTLDSIDLGQVKSLVSLVGVPLEGKLGGEVKLAMPEGKATKGSGSVELEAHDVAVGDGKAKLQGQFALPRMAVGTLSFSADAKEGVLKITKLAAGGKDLELQGDGRIQMRELAPESICDVSVRFKINDTYRSQSKSTEALFGAPGSSMAPLIEMNADVKRSKRSDGFYGWAVRGPLGHPDYIPSPGSGGGTLPAVPLPSGGAVVRPGGMMPSPGGLTPKVAP